MRYEIKALTIGGILDQAVMLLRIHFKMLLTITLFIYIPGLLVVSYLSYMLMPGPMPTTTGAEIPEFGMAFLLLNLIWGLVAMFFVIPVTNAAVIRAVADEYLGRPASAQGSFKHALKVLLPLIFTSFIAWILIFLGSLLFLIPGIWLTFRYWFTSYIVVIEGTKGRAALKRSRALMKGNMGTGFVLALLLFVIGLAVSMVVAFVPVQVIAILVQVLIQAALFIFGAAASAVFYFSCRCKLENFDLTVLADTVGKEVTDEARGAGLSVGAAQ